MDSFTSDLDSNQSLIEEVETQAMTGGEPTTITVDDEKSKNLTYLGICRGYNNCHCTMYTKGTYSSSSLKDREGSSVGPFAIT